MSSETKVVISLIVLTLIVIVGGIFLVSNQAANTSGDVKIDKAILIRPDSKQIAGKNSKVSIVEFADYECPSCAALYPNLKKLLSTDGDKITFVYRNFLIHSGSMQAAVAALAAGEQGKYWEMHDILFEKQDEWSVAATDKDRGVFFEKYATQIGLDIAKYKTDIANSKFTDMVNRDQTDGTSMNVHATPTVIINGSKLVIGSISYTELKKIVDDEIAGNASTATVETGSSTKAK